MSALPPVVAHPRSTGALRQFAHAADIGLALGDRDHPARLERVEDMAGLDRLVIGRERQLALDIATLYTIPAPILPLRLSPPASLALLTPCLKRSNS